MPDDIPAIVREALILDRTDTAEDLLAKAESLRRDCIRDLAQLSQGLDSGYIDDHLLLRVYARLVESRQLKQLADELCPTPNSSTSS